MAYTKTSAVVANVTTVKAAWHNSLMAEMKAAVEGVPTHDVDITIAYTGGSDGDLPETITITDNSGDTGYNITLTATITYDADDLPTQIEYIFDAGEMNITVIETYTYDGNDNITAISRTIS